MALLPMFLHPHLQSLRDALPKPRRRHLLLLPAGVLLVVVLFNAGLVALVWNRFGLHRLLHVRRLSTRGCLIAGVVLMCFGL